MGSVDALEDVVVDLNLARVVLQASSSPFSGCSVGMDAFFHSCLSVEMEVWMDGMDPEWLPSGSDVRRFSSVLRSQDRSPRLDQMLFRASSSSAWSLTSEMAVLKLSMAVCSSSWKASSSSPSGAKSWASSRL